MLIRTDSTTNILLYALGSVRNEKFAMAILKFIVNQPEDLSDDGIKSSFFQKGGLFKRNDEIFYFFI